MTQRNTMVDHFVQGVLTVEDEVYLSEPDLRLADGKKVRILYNDMRLDEDQSEDDPLSLLLEINQWYEMLLIIQIGLGRGKKVSYSSKLPSDTKLELISTNISGVSGVIQRNDVLQGVILDLNWDTTSQHYLVSAEAVLRSRRFVLIETAIGKMVLNYKALQERLGEQMSELALGGYLEWERSRLDLLAIIEKRDPLSGE